MVLVFNNYILKSFLQATPVRLTIMEKVIMLFSH